MNEDDDVDGGNFIFEGEVLLVYKIYSCASSWFVDRTNN